MRRGLRTVPVPAFVSLLLVAMLTISSFAMPSSTQSAFVISTPAGTGGPSFIDLGNWFVDTTLITEPIELHPMLELFVQIWDEVTVNLAIGCFKKSNETQWSNATMTFLDYSTLDSRIHHFGANATEFTLSPSHPLEVWNVKYYAHDTLGRWNLSEVVNGSICALYGQWPTSETSTPIDPLIPTVALISVAVAIAVVVVAWRKMHSSAGHLS